MGPVGACSKCTKVNYLGLKLNMCISKRQIVMDYIFFERSWNVDFMCGITFQVLEFIRRKKISWSLHKEAYSEFFLPFETQVWEDALFSKYFLITIFWWSFTNCYCVSYEKFDIRNN
jgi:hypothetical protein